MNQVALNTISYFDSGKRPSEKSGPERFYHGFVLGLMVDLEEQYTILSNRESGFGWYDVMLAVRKYGFAFLPQASLARQNGQQGAERFGGAAVAFEGKNVLILEQKG